MRLTLRTLLAYLDNILEPTAAQQLAAKIEESQTAADLVHRIRDVTKKVRLAAPAIDGKGMGLDANTVAEYLDNTLTSESTPDFEMVCLESDVHLAEVAACHEILSLVLVQAVEIDPGTRQKMYTLLSQTESAILKKAAAQVPTAQTAPVAPVAVPVAAPAKTVPPTDAKGKREVPEYLKGSTDEAAMARRGWMLAAVALVALILVGTTFVLAVIPLNVLPESLRPLANAIFPREIPVAQNDGPAPPKPTPTAKVADEIPVPPANGTASATVPPTGIAPPPPASPSATTGGLLQPPSAVTPSGLTPAASGTAPVPPVPTDIGPGGLLPPVPTATASAATAPTVVPTVPTVVPTAPTVVPTAPTVVPTAPTVVPTVPPAVPTATPATTVAVAPAVPVPSATTTPVTPVAPVQPAKIEPVGRVSSAGSQVLLRFDPKTRGWVRLPARELLSVGDRLLALPAYRPQVSLVNGLTIDLLGGAVVELAAIDAGGTPGLVLERGRLMAYNVGGPKASLRLEQGASPATVTLSAAELGIEYRPRRAPGGDPTQLVPGGVMLYAKSGQVSFGAPMQPETPLTVPGGVLLTEEAAPVVDPAAAATPTWLTSDERDLLEKQAADFVELGLRSDKAVSIALREMTTDRRAENVQLALRALAQIGEFDDFMPLLRDPTQRYGTWERLLRLLADALDYGPASAAQVRDAFVRQYGPTGEGLYRMLWSYSDDQLKAGGAQLLVEALDHEDLAFRVVSIWTLCDITGQAPTGYLPQDQQVKRKAAILKWEQKLKDGTIAQKKS